MTSFNLAITEPDSDWMQRLAKNNRLLSQLESDPKKQELKNKLRDACGVALILPNVEEDIDKILERGEFLLGKELILAEGEPNNCHKNAAKYWFDHSKKHCLMTGYALSSDGVWRQHSWCLFNKSRTVVETTEKRLLYFGFRLTRRESVVFLLQNM
jgi:hypothetical protein